MSYAKFPGLKTRSISGPTTVTPVATTDALIIATALAAGCTMAAPTGTPKDGQELMFRIKDNGTTRAITWNAIYISSGVPTLLANTSINKTHTVLFRYDVSAVKWICLQSDNTGY